MRIKIIIGTIILAFLSSCNNDSTTVSAPDSSLEEINIRIPRDPQRIHPIFAPTSSGREIFQYSFLSLADFHPESLELTPILIKDIPDGYITKQENEEWISYDLEFKPDAKWSDGTAITGKDYAFTMNLINHPLSKAGAWRPYFSSIREVKVNMDNPKKLTVSFTSDYMLSLEAATTINLFPSHVYDSEDKISTIAISQLLADGYEEKDTSLNKLFEVINNSVNDKTDVVQSGPYYLTNYEPNQYYILTKKENYWGNNYPNNPFLEAHAGKLIFKIVPDELTAVTMAKEGKLDLIMMKNSTAFLDLKDDKEAGADWNFHVPQLIRYYYLSLNNKSEILSDKSVRNALSHLADIDDYIENLDGGLGVRTIGHFHPTKSYYNEKLTPIAYDIDKANKLLEEAGWIDTDNDKIRDKVIAGKRIALSLDLLFTGSPLSKNIALLYQESASKAGVQINMVTKKSSLMRKENLSNHNYDIAMLIVGQDAAPDDPYSKWHSDNASKGAENVTGYSNPEVDKLIERLRTNRSKSERKEMYLEIQRIMYEDQPAVFLYCPLNKIIINDRLAATSSPKRPGYMANTFKSK